MTCQDLDRQDAISSDFPESRSWRYPSLRAPLDVLFLVCCIALTADVLVPEIWGNGKTKDYPLWFWAGQQVLHGRQSLSQQSRRHVRLHLPAAVGAAARDPRLVRQDPALSVPVAVQRRGVVDDGAIFQRDDGIGPDTWPVAVRAARLRHGDLRVRHVRSRAAEPRPAGDDAVRFLAAAAGAALDGGRPVCAGHRDQGVPGRGFSVPDLAPAMGGRRRHDRLPRRVPVRAAGAVPRRPSTMRRN